MRTLKSKTCHVCYIKFTPARPLQQVCSITCASKYITKKEIDKRVKEMKKSVQSISDLEKMAKVVFQKWVRKRDEGKPCISCGAGGSKIDGGHFFSCEAYSGLIFHEDNVHGQCHHCNRFLHGNFFEYRKGLIQRIGEERVKELESLADFNRVRKFTREELIEIAKKYKLKLKE